MVIISQKIKSVKNNIDISRKNVRAAGLAVQDPAGERTDCVEGQADLRELYPIWR
jgi:hypothetical protein